MAGPTQTIGGFLKVALKEFYGKVALWAVNAAGIEVEVLAEDDGTVRSALIGHDGTNLKNLKTEATATAAELMVSNYGKVSGTITAFELDAGGEFQSVLYGKDSGSNIDPLRTNDDQQLQVEVINDSSVYVQIDPQLIAAAEADLWDPGADAGDMYDVEFLVVNVDGTNAVDVSVGQDVAGGGNLADGEYFMKTETVPAKGSSGWRGPFRIGGDDHIRGVAGAANDAAIHFRVKKVKDV